VSVTDGTDRRKASFARWLDRLSRQQLQQVESDLCITAETLDLFSRFRLTITVHSSNEAQAAAEIKGPECFERFIEALARRLRTKPESSA
jgi:hypothetical protein